MVSSAALCRKTDEPALVRTPARRADARHGPAVVQASRESARSFPSIIADIAGLFLHRKRLSLSVRPSPSQSPEVSALHHAVLLRAASLKPPS